MRSEARTKIRAEIIHVLDERKTETSLTDLLQSLHARGERDETLIKAAVWELIADGDIELTPTRRLVRPSEKQRQYALAL